ncbi:MAG: pyridoxamine 5-phosphate oxidase [Ilumatobacteraceae bacterium]|nr:pyridoxamine 5-phosphate oxidase [Ilumatobacteraceae bacterium]
MIGFGAQATEFRPLTVARATDNRIEILLDTSEPWAKDIHDGDSAVATLSDNRKNAWASMHGRATLTTDAEAIDDLWNPAAAAFFDNGRQSVGIAVLRIAVDSGHYWSAPSGRLGNLITMVKAKLGSSEDSGEHGPITV